MEELVEEEDGRALTHRSTSQFRFYASTLTHMQPHEGIIGRELIAHTYRTLLPVLLPRRVRVEEALPNTNWARVWSNIQSRTLSMRARSHWFMAVHDIVPTNNRLHAIHRAPSDRCQFCGKWDTILHRLTTCGHAATIWRWLKERLKTIQVPHEGTSLAQDFLIRPDILLNTSKRRANAAAWLIGHIVMGIMSEERAPTLADLIANTLTPLRETVLNSPRTVKRRYGTHLDTLL
jgi:hypothetical protein